jgi:hypothetical protein
VLITPFTSLPAGPRPSPHERAIAQHLGNIPGGKNRFLAVSKWTTTASMAAMADRRGAVTERKAVRVQI